MKYKMLGFAFVTHPFGPGGDELQRQQHDKRISDHFV
jgi:hypothetical protein